MSVLSVQNLIYGYSKGTPFEKRALDGASFDFERGEIVALIGHTGSGKSTFLKHLNGLLKADSGDVLIDGESIFSSKKTLYECRFKIGLCFQYPEQQLFESTVYKDIAFGPANMKLCDEEIERRVYRSMDFVGLSRDYAERSPFDLSGGEKRKVAIAGVLAMEPSVLVLDEPTAGLDPSGKRSLLRLIKKYNKEMGSAVVFVSHNMDDVAVLADRIAVLDGGKVILSGTPAEVFSHTDTLISRGLGVPDITTIFVKLRESGLDLPANIYTVDDGVEALLSFLERRAAK